MIQIHYVVTAGEYSDYHICAVFSDPEKAKQYCERFGGTVEEFPDTEEVPRPLYWECRLAEDGRKRTRKLSYVEDRQPDPEGDIWNSPRGRVLMNIWLGDELAQGVHRYGETEEEAIKNAVDALRKAKARLAGIA